MITPAMRLTHQTRCLIAELKNRGECTWDLSGASVEYLIHLAGLYGFDGREYLEVQS